MLNKNAKKYFDSSKSSVSIDKSGKIRLDLAEGFFEPPLGLVSKLGEIGPNEISSLPDMNCSNLKSTIGEFLAILPENISVFSGSDEAIEIIPRIYLNEKEISLCLVPTFSRMISSPRKVGAKVELFPLKRVEGYRVSAKSFSQLSMYIDKLKPKILWICSPNNPTGVIVDLKLIKKLLSMFPKTLFVVNEVYQEFYSLNHNKSAVSLIKSRRNLLVIRSFSKAFGLAGVRVGYVVAHRSRASEIERFRTKYNISTLSQILAIEALKDPKYVANLVKIVELERERVLDYLSSTCPNIKFITGSATNLILMKHKSKDLFLELYKRGAVASDWRKAEGISGEGFVRITIGQREHNDKIIEIMKEIN